MKGDIKVTPLDDALFANRKELGSAVSDFVALHSLPVKSSTMAWAVYWQDGEAFKVLGFASCNTGKNVADVPVYHIDQGDDRQGQWMAAKAHEVLFARVCGFAADVAGSDVQPMFYISPDMQEHWKAFAKKVKGKNANRFVMEVA